MENLLDVSHLQTVFQTDKGEITSVEEVSFSLKKGETVAIVGESGCGKSVTSLSIMKLLGKHGNIKKGSILFKGKDIATFSEKEIRNINKVIAPHLAGGQLFVNSNVLLRKARKKNSLKGCNV